VPIFIERFLIVVCAAAFYGLVITNAMGFDLHQRIGLGLVLIGAAYFLGHTAYKKPSPTAPIPAATAPAQPSQQNTTTGPQSPIMPNNSGNVTISSDDSKPKEPPPKDKPK